MNKKVVKHVFKIMHVNMFSFSFEFLILFLLYFESNFKNNFGTIYPDNVNDYNN